MERALYSRVKEAPGKWRYVPIPLGRGKRKAGEDPQPPFYSRHMGSDGNRYWTRMDAQTFAAALDEINEIERTRQARAADLSVAEMKEADRAGRITLREAIDKFMIRRQSNPIRTRLAYTRTLEHFAKSMPFRFIDGHSAAAITEMLIGYKQKLEVEGYGLGTIKNHLVNACTLLKANGYLNPSKGVSIPKPDKKAVKPYTTKELDQLFGHLTNLMKSGETDTIRARAADDFDAYRVFLTSSLREQEVQYLTWADINFETGEVTVEGKPKDGFTVKNHGTRTFRLPTETIQILQARHDRTGAKSRWIFTSNSGRPEGHFLRKLKEVTLAAGLNCGHCWTKVKRDGKESEICCKTNPVCERWNLHRFRKTRATFWKDKGINLDTIRIWLGHKELKTTQIYLDTNSKVQDSEWQKIDAAY